MDQQIRVLVVDDDEPHAEAVAESLERVGYDCTVVSSGREALRLIEEQEFDIILMDLQMPVMDGFECTARIRKTHPELPILALTAARSAEIDAKTVAAGMNDIVGKPFIPKELRAKILLHLKNTPAA